MQATKGWQRQSRLLTTLYIYRRLNDSMHATQMPKSKLKFVTLDKEICFDTMMSTPWRQFFLTTENLQHREGTGNGGDNMSRSASKNAANSARFDLEPCPPHPTLHCCFLTFPIQAVISCILRLILNRHLPSLVPVPATHTLRLGAFEQSARSAVLESGKHDISSTLERAFLCSGETFCVTSLPPKKVF